MTRTGECTKSIGDGSFQLLAVIPAGCLVSLSGEMQAGQQVSEFQILDYGGKVCIQSNSLRPPL